MESSKSGAIPLKANPIPIPKRVAHVMRIDPPYCTPEDTICTAARLMTASGSEFLPVVEPQHNGELIGALTASDVAAIAADAMSGAETPVSEAMSRAPLCCSIDDDLETIAELMDERGVSGVAVVDAWGCCIGIVDGHKLQRAVAPQAPLTPAPSLSQRASVRRGSTSCSSSVTTDRQPLRL